MNKVDKKNKILALLELLFWWEETKRKETKITINELDFLLESSKCYERKQTNKQSNIYLYNQRKLGHWGRVARLNGTVRVGTR